MIWCDFSGVGTASFNGWLSQGSQPLCIFRPLQFVPPYQLPVGLSGALQSEITLFLLVTFSGLDFLENKLEVA